MSATSSADTTADTTAVTNSMTNADTTADTTQTHHPFTDDSVLTIHPQPLSLSSFVFLANGVRLPLLGYGTTHQGGFSRAAFDAAIKDAGICLIDTARRYGTEKLIGDAIKNSKIGRNKFFITTKVWPSDYGYDSALASITASLKDLGTFYIDLLLMHWPDCPHSCEDKEATLRETWRAFNDAYARGIVRAIGVSNFNVEQMEVAFGKKTDKSGEYIRKWLPILKKFPDQYIYEPWKAPLAVQKAAGCVIGQDYPKPIVDHDVVSKQNIARMKAAYARKNANSDTGDGDSTKKAEKAKPSVAKSGGGNGKSKGSKRQAEDATGAIDKFVKKKK